MQNIKEKISLGQLRTDLKYLEILTLKSELNSEENEKTWNFYESIIIFYNLN